jgi:hypothetical protein
VRRDKWKNVKKRKEGKVELKCKASVKEAKIKAKRIRV